MARSLLVNWLQNPDWKEEELIYMLKGYGLPPSGSDVEPFRYILEALPQGPLRGLAQKELARRAGRLLIRLKAGPQADDPELEYNLLMMCAGLSCPEELADSLWVVLEKGVTGTWTGIELGYALAAALVSNQIDSRFQHIWEDMLRGLSHPVLRGTTFTALEGIIRMPASQSSRSQPALDEISRAFRLFASAVELNEQREEMFLDALKMFTNAYPELSFAGPELLRLIGEQRWPAWTLNVVGADAELRKEELTFASKDWEVLEVLRTEGDQLIPDIAILARLTPSELRDTLQRLKGKQLVREVGGEFVRLTREGRSVRRLKPS